MKQRQQSLLIWCAVVLSIAGCGPVGAWWPLVVLALSLVASACIEVSLPSKPDSGPSVAEPDASEAGSWHSCCEDGVITTCFCPANAACNFAPFTDCGDGTCNYAWEEPACGAHDGGSPVDGGADAGSWDRCCQDGVITTCFCPAGTICNYVDFFDCGNGTCSFAPGNPGPVCGAPDGGPRDGGVSDAGPDGGSWDVCCQNGVITTCFCPAQVACNYGWFTDCGDGTCDLRDYTITQGVCGGDAGPDGGGYDAGPDSGGDAGGSWDTCCENGAITTCFCPAGVACNYGWFTSCGDGTCVEGIFPADAGVCALAAGQDAG